MTTQRTTTTTTTTDTLGDTKPNFPMGHTEFHKKLQAIFQHSKCWTACSDRGNTRITHRASRLGTVVITTADIYSLWRANVSSMGDIAEAIGRLVSLYWSSRGLESRYKFFLSDTATKSEGL